jgi:hypothetical protein
LIACWHMALALRSVKRRCSNGPFAG